MHEQHQVMMQRCLDLGLQGAGHVAPNPMVGCVIVHEARIIGEGFHHEFGGPHAEVNAIESVASQDESLLTSATLFVNLEPCSHQGKTPPCADLIISKKIPSVVIGCIDPNPLVAGSGIEKLKAAGCKVAVGILEAESKNLNKRFFTFIQKKRPYVILKWAQTLDGFIAPADGKKTIISNEYSQQLVHKWRSEEASIMVGRKTALADNPHLDARMWNGNSPVRIVIDRDLQLPASLHIFDQSIPTIVFTLHEKAATEKIRYIQVAFNEHLAEAILLSLYQEGIQSVFIEGGATLLQTFIDSGYWDEARIFTGDKLFQEGIAGPKINGTVAEKHSIGTDQLLLIHPSPENNPQPSR
jgi:diaminohydroxyphosphoribosylaminopyrimidine deaminase/5-amino-6-(5-phosphoribosylamino)uracil reductase